MPRKGKGVRRILREERRFREKKKQGSKFRRIRRSKGKESLSSVNKSTAQLRKADKAKDLYRASSNIQTAVKKEKEAEEIGRELTGAEGEGKEA